MHTIRRNICNLSNKIKLHECRLTQHALKGNCFRYLVTSSINQKPSIQPEWVAKESNLVFPVQQVRKYAPVAAQLSKCWNCKKPTERKNHMICVACGHLQDVDTDINFFDLLNFPQNFDLKSQELTQRFRHLQTLVHPDKFSNKTPREQTNSADWSSLINKAYKTLSIPIKRGQYILRLYGQYIPEDNSTVDKEFLMNMMERNEEVEGTNSQVELQRLNDQVTQEFNEKVDELNAQFEVNALEAAKSILVQMKYFLSLQNAIKNKLQALMGA